MGWWRLSVVGLLAVILLGPTGACAQARGTATRPGGANAQAAPAPAAPALQGSRLLEGLIPPPAPPPPDYPEEMRQLVEKIASYGRSLRPDFSIVVQNGLDLLQKSDDMAPLRKVPANAFIRSINGMLLAPLYFGAPQVDQAVDEKITAGRIELAELARQSGAKILVLDYGKNAKAIDSAHRMARKRGYLSYTAEAAGADIRTIARHPSRPFDENPNSVLSLCDAHNFLYLRDAQGMGRQDEYALKLHNLNHDLLIIDVFQGRTPLQKQAIDMMKFKKTGARRLVFAYLDIGHAASYRYYWKAEWRKAPPSWIESQLPGDPDAYYVKYWDQGWHDLLAGSPNSFVYGALKLGFDGVVLDGVDAFKYFEGR